MQKSSKILAALLALGVITFSFGCSQEKKPAQTEGAKVIQKVINNPVRADFAPLGEIKEGRKNVYVLVKTLHNSYWKELVRGVEASGKANNVNLYLGAALREIDWETQKAMLGELKGKKVDGLVLAPTDSTLMAPIVKDLQAKKLPVVLVDTTLNGNVFSAGYMTNNAVAGVQAANEMLNLLKAAGAKENEELVVRIQQSSTASNTIMERLAGLTSEWNKKAPKSWKLDPQPVLDKGDRAIARQNTAEILKTPKLRGIFALNNRPTVAVAETIMKNNRKDVVMMGFDYAPGSAVMVKSPDYKAATIVQNQYKMGFEAVKTAAELANGAKASGKITDTGIQVLNAANIAQYEAANKK